MVNRGQMSRTSFITNCGRFENQGRIDDFACITNTSGAVFVVAEGGTVETSSFSVGEYRDFGGTTESLRVFRSCPLITPKDAQSSLQMLAIARYGCVLRLDRTPFERAARSRPKNSQALTRRAPRPWHGSTAR